MLNAAAYIAFLLREPLMATDLFMPIKLVSIKRQPDAVETLYNL